MFCPLTKEECVKEKCSWWVKLMQKNADQTLKEISSCAIPLLVDVGIDTSKGVLRVQSAVESERNTMNSVKNVFLHLLKGNRQIGG